MYPIIIPPHNTKSLPPLYKLWIPYITNPFTQPSFTTLPHIRSYSNTHQIFKSCPCTQPLTTHILTHTYSTHTITIHRNHHNFQHMKLTTLKASNLHTPHMYAPTIYLTHVAPPPTITKFFIETYSLPYIQSPLLPPYPPPHHHPPVTLTTISIYLESITP